MTDQSLIPASGKFLGVCAWVANKFSVDVKIIRILFIVAALFTIGSPILLYFVLAIIKALIE